MGFRFISEGSGIGSRLNLIGRGNGLTSICSRIIAKRFVVGSWASKIALRDWAVLILDRLGFE